MEYDQHPNVRVLDPQAEATYTAMLTGWERKLFVAGDKPKSIRAYHRTIDQVRTFLQGALPWEWSGDDVNRWGAARGQAVARRTLRGEQGALRDFRDHYLCDPAYPWLERIEFEYGVRMRPLCTPENTLPHRSHEENPARRPLTERELETFFAYLRDQIERCLTHHRKCALIAARDYALYVHVLAWGLRVREAAKGETFDFSEAGDPELKRAYGAFGVYHVRWGKAIRRGQPRSRFVYTVPLYEFAAEVMRWYVEIIRPHFAPKRGHETALWLTERGTMLSASYVSSRFAIVRARCGLPKEITPHFLRPTYVTRLLENNYPQEFVSEQVGHDDSAVTAGYTTVGDDFIRTTLTEALRQ